MSLGTHRHHVVGAGDPCFRIDFSSSSSERFPWHHFAIWKISDSVKDMCPENEVTPSPSETKFSSINRPCFRMWKPLLTCFACLSRKYFSDMILVIVKNGNERLMLRRRVKSTIDRLHENIK